MLCAIKSDVVCICSVHKKLMLLLELRHKLVYNYKLIDIILSTLCQDGLSLISHLVELLPAC